jgi:uncharacterized membrane protein
MIITLLIGNAIIVVFGVFVTYLLCCWIARVETQQDKQGSAINALSRTIARPVMSPEEVARRKAHAESVMRAAMNSHLN